MKFSDEDIFCRYLLFDMDNVHKVFLKWIEKLGLKEYFDRNSILELIDVGLLSPSLRIDLPQEFFAAWQNHPIKPVQISEGVNSFKNCGLYKINFKPDFQNGKWFFHPYDTEDEEIKEFLGYQVDHDTPYPEPYLHERNRETHRTRMFFPYWIAYYLWELLPNIYPKSLRIKSYKIEDDIRNISRGSDYCEIFNKAKLERSRERREQLGEVFNYISYYRTLQGLVYTAKLETLDIEVLKNGIDRLTTFLSITEEQLFSYLIIELELFDKWQRRKKGIFPVAEEAVRSLQKDIYFTVEWLRHVSSQPWQYIIDKIRMDFPHISGLEKALPFESYLSKEHYKKYKNYYLKAFNTSLPDIVKLDTGKFDVQIDTNYDVKNSFQYVTRAYQRLHECLSSEYEIDFSSKDILDYLIVVYTRVEAFLIEVILFNESGTFQPLMQKYKQLSKNTFISRALKYAIQNMKYAHFNRNTNHNPFVSATEISYSRTDKDIKNNKNLNEPNLGYSNNIEHLGFRIVRFALVRNMFAHTSDFDELIYENRGELFKDVNIILAYLPGVKQDIFI